MTTTFKPYPEQLAAAKAVARYHRGIISAVTASGKSIIAALIIEELQVRTLVVVPSLELKSQLSKDMSKWFGTTKVGKNKDIYIENVQALDPKTVLKGYDCVIIDEFHHSGAKTYQKLNKNSWKNIYYRVGLTGTPFRNNEDERLLLESILSEVIYRLDYKTAVKRGYIAQVDSYFIEIPKQTSAGISWAQVYNELVVNNDIRNAIIGRLLTNLSESDTATLCLVKEVAHGQAIADLTGIPFVNGADDESRDYIRQFNAGGIKALIGTSGVLGEGVDTKPAEFIIIAGLGKAKSAFMQWVGRGLRKFSGKDSAKIVIIKDNSHKWTTKHFKEQSKILKDEYDSIPTKLDIE